MALTTPRIGSTKDFWGTLKSISVAQIAREAHRPLSVAIVGAAELRSQARKALYTTPLPLPEKGVALPEPSYLQEYESTSEEAGFPRDAIDLV